MSKSWRAWGLILLVVAGLAGCSAPPERIFIPIQFDQSGNYRLDVASVMIVESYRPPLRAPNVDHESPIPPLDGIRGWATQRFLAIGSKGALRVTVVDASIVEEPLQVNQDIESTFTTERAARMKGRAEVLLEVLDANGKVRAETEAEVTRTRTLAEGATLLDRDQFLYELTRDLVHDLDKTIEPGVRRYLVAYLR